MLHTSAELCRASTAHSIGGMRITPTEIEKVEYKVVSTLPRRLTALFRHNNDVHLLSNVRTNAALLLRIYRCVLAGAIKANRYANEKQIADRAIAVMRNPTTKKT